MFIFLIQKGTTPKQEKSTLEKNAIHYEEIFKSEYTIEQLLKMQNAKKVPSEFSFTTDIEFNMKTSPKDLNNMYLYIDSKAAPLTDTYWKLDNLATK